MKVMTREFQSSASRALADVRLQQAHEVVYNGFHRARLIAAGETENWEAQRSLAKAIKDHTIANLDYYLDKLATNVEENGGKVHFAHDAVDANGYVRELATKNDVSTIIKSKSMVSEEMGINDVLESDGIEVVETDLGEYIVQLAGEKPYHIIAPAIHKTKAQIAQLLANESNSELQETAGQLTRQAREILREVFQRADMSITGANFAVAETGSIVLVTNEGNGRMATSMPRIHVGVMGMEKIIPSVADLSAMLRVLIRSATGQRISCYVTMVNGPRAQDEEDGPEEFHLVIMNNGRDRLLQDESLREALNCIRCGACINSCPVYRKVGGHSYGWVYPGPIGSIISPVLTGLKDGANLPAASSLCGACHEACPVKINIPRMLLELRSQTAQGEPNPENKASGFGERMIWKAWRQGMMSRRRFEAGASVGKLITSPAKRDGWLSKVPPPISGWTDSREFPAPAERTFGKMFAERKRARNDTLI